MKKIILLLTLFFVLIGASAQNANRTGFFTELAYGSYSGTSYYKVQWNPAQIKIQPISGTAVNLAIGYRIKMSRSFALDIRVQAQSFIYKKMEDISVGPVISARYTSPEIFKNVSLYASAGIGYYNTRKIGKKKYGFSASGISSQSGSDYYYLWDRSRMPILINCGMNFTTHFYGGVVYDMLLATSNPIRIGSLLGVQLGYRF